MRARPRQPGQPAFLLAIGAITGMVAIAAMAAITGMAAERGDLRLVDAARAQDASAVRTLVDQQTPVDIAQPDGATALHWAAHWDNLPIADLLIRAGADVNVTKRAWGRAALPGMYQWQRRNGPTTARP